MIAIEADRTKPSTIELRRELARALVESAKVEKRHKVLVSAVRCFER